MLTWKPTTDGVRTRVYGRRPCTLTHLQAQDEKKYQEVTRTLGLMQTNLKHPGLHNHAYVSITGPAGEKLFEAYVENRTPGAYRVFWYYGPGQGTITIVAVIPHP